MIEYLKYNILPSIIYLLVRLIYATNKKVYHYSTVNSDEPLIISIWHGDLIFQPFNYQNFRKNGKGKVIISQNKDGKIATKFALLCKLGVIRGSSSRGSTKVLIEAISELKKGNDIAITPDGPRGPRFSIANGVIAIAQKSGAKIVCFNSIASKYWQFNSWDKFVLPKPFSKIDFYVSEPIDVKNLSLEEAKQIVKDKMLIHTMS